MKIDYSVDRCIFDGVTGEAILDNFSEAICSFFASNNVYGSAIREITTKLENLNDEFKITIDRNPIYQIISRVKPPKSITEKLKRKGCELSIKSARANINDIAGVRVICPYVEDIYLIAKLLTDQDDIELLNTKDYIKNPKPNGYRSLHIEVKVPVFLSKRKEMVKVEIQIRTIAMDFWASLEHDLAYKLTGQITGEMVQELKDCADVIAQTDHRMQKMYNKIFTLNNQLQ